MGAEDFDKMQAYKIANGQVNANPLVDKDGMINLAMDYESEQESEGIVQKCIGLPRNSQKFEQFQFRFLFYFKPDHMLFVLNDPFIMLCSYPEIGDFKEKLD